MNVFLSASIPQIERNPKYFETMDVLLIREAIKGLVLVLLENEGKLVFGGHPAITPLVRLLFNDAGRAPKKYVTLYQSNFYERDFPPDNDAFENLVVTKAINNNKIESLKFMREQMLTSKKYDCGVFIGGMEGVEVEFKMFRKFCGAPTFPVSSTGAAAKILYKEYSGFPVELDTELTYPTLFRKLFAEL